MQAVRPPSRGKHDGLKVFLGPILRFQLRARLGSPWRRRLSPLANPTVHDCRSGFLLSKRMGKASPVCTLSGDSAQKLLSFRGTDCPAIPQPVAVIMYYILDILTCLHYTWGLPSPCLEVTLSETDLKQRHPFARFYLAAAAFLALLGLAQFLPSPWQHLALLLTLCFAGYSLWSFYRLFSLADERQRQTNQQALQFGFLATIVLAMLGGFLQGFRPVHVSWGGILALMVIAWSVGLIVFSWRYR